MFRHDSGDPPGYSFLVTGAHKVILSLDDAKLFLVGEAFRILAMTLSRIARRHDASCPCDVINANDPNIDLLFYTRQNSSESILRIVKPAPITPATCHKAMAGYNMRQKPHLLRFVRKTPATCQNSLRQCLIRQNVKLWRLFQRHAISI